MTAWSFTRACLLWVALLSALPAVAGSAATVEEPVAGGLYDLMAARLLLMRNVAAHKWHHRQPVEDLEREAVVIDQAVRDALRHGLTLSSSRMFFAVQIEAAKEVQRYWFEVWERGSPPAVPPDLDDLVRPELLRLGSAILAASVADNASVRPPDSLGVEGLSEPTERALLVAAAGLTRYPNRLRQILDSGLLRVGTTGDYAPFSYRGDGAAEFSGSDIDLARKLADALGVEVVFFHTSWPMLMADLAEGQYDIGMSGISRLLDRQKHGFFSVPYYVAGKTPIARCDAAGRLASLEAIDQPGVRVVVNPGGTNEAFVDANIRRADKVIHGDNRTIFQVLIDGGADVMITDRVEVELQVSRHDALCATMNEDLTYQDKAYLMPQDSTWKAFVDVWLALALADGTVAEVFGRHGVRITQPPAF
jgi:cyclohexadienyl dehydratase